MRYFADGKTACAALGRLSVVALAALLMAGCTSGEEAQNEGTEENDRGNAGQPSEGASSDG